MLKRIEARAEYDLLDDKVSGEPRYLMLQFCTEWIENFRDELEQINQSKIEIVTSNASSVSNRYVHSRLKRDKIYGNGYRFVECVPHPENTTYLVSTISMDHITTQTGSYIYRFQGPDDAVVTVYSIVKPYEDNGATSWQWYSVMAVGIPDFFVEAWHGFVTECTRLADAIEPQGEVIIIGGKKASFKPTTSWDDIVLPENIKTDIINDVSSFFTKGVGIYTKLKLKPFRKIMLAGPPGTGKTMLCSAIAKWGVDNQFVVIYVSSAHKDQGEAHGSTFAKIEEAIRTASASDYPVIILLEELDAYLHDDEKAMVLNVLDGNEADPNPNGILLVATTNYPEAIDERIMKRPGRLDRVFVIPETKSQEDAEKMLRLYLGDLWDDQFVKLIPQITGFTGAFIREVAIYALTQCAEHDLEHMPYELLQASFDNLRDRIEERDAYMKTRAGFHDLTSAPEKDDVPKRIASSKTGGLPMP